MPVASSTPRINADFPEIDRASTTDARLSDHDPLVVFFQVAAFASAGLSTTVVDSPDPVLAGAGLAYTITVTNGGPDAATGLTLTDTLPAGTVFASLVAPAGWSLHHAGRRRRRHRHLHRRRARRLDERRLHADGHRRRRRPGGTVLSNTAAVTQTSSDPNPADDSGTATTTVQTPAAVIATKTASGSYLPGGLLTYTIVLTNTGTTAQLDNPGDELVDVLPSSLALVNATATSGTAVATVATNTVTWNGAIPGGGRSRSRSRRPS